MYLTVLEALVIVVALSVDAFLSSFAYGAERIRIPLSSAAVISLVCSLLLAASLFFGGLLSGFLAPGLTAGICAATLGLLGLVRLCDGVLKALIRRHNRFRREIRFSAFSLGFILQVYADPEHADRDRSKLLSPAEAASLAAALSLDGLAAGFGAGIACTNPLLMVAFSLVINMAAVVLGHRLGGRLARRLTFDFEWISGALLLVLAAAKLL